jgi:hypothetical protein
MSPIPRVRRDQPTIATLEQTVAEAQAAALKCFTAAGFFRVQLVVTAVATSIDPDGDCSTWAAATRVPDKPDTLLAQSLRFSAEEASP